MAVSANDNVVKILANTDGLRLLRTFDGRSFDASRGVLEAASKVYINWLHIEFISRYF